jgi:hypothetical protein
MAAERGVHLFRGEVLFANLTTTEDEPPTTYEIDGLDYDVSSISGPHPRDDGTEAWIVQVARTRRWV